MNSHLVFLLVYSVGLTVLGLYIGRRVESAGAFFVAGRSLGPVLIFATVLAANIGAASTVGAAGLGYRDGLSAWWWGGSAGIGTLVLAFWIGPKIWRIARERDLYTVGDYLEYRYGPSVRATIAVLLWFVTLAALAGQLIAVAWVLNVVAGVPKWMGCVIGGGVVIIYFAAGGLLSSAWVNLVQLVVLLVGFALALPLALSGVGWESVVAAASESNDYLNFWRGGDSGWVYLALLGPAFMISPGLIQKIYGVRDERAIRLGVGAAAFALMGFAVIPPLMGMIANAYDPSLANAELALPTVLTVAVPAAVGSIGLAAIFSAEISSADAILFMLSTSLSKDLFKRFVRPAASNAEVLHVARLAAIAAGVLGVLLAIALPSVIESLRIFYALLTVSLFVPVVAGLYTRRPGIPEALAAIGAGVGVLVVLRLTPWGATIGSWSPSTFGLIASGVLFGAVFVVRAVRST